jgi:hypothetical protein
MRYQNRLEHWFLTSIFSQVKGMYLGRLQSSLQTLEKAKKLFFYYIDYLSSLMLYQNRLEPLFLTSILSLVEYWSMLPEAYSRGEYLKGTAFG